MTAARCCKRGQTQARVAAVLLLTLPGTPTLYYGDELGLSDVEISSAQIRTRASYANPVYVGPRSRAYADAVDKSEKCWPSPLPSRGYRSMPTIRSVTSRR